MATIIPFFGHIDLAMVAFFKQKLQPIPREETITLRINSLGGNLDALNRISELLFSKREHGRNKIHGELLYGESAGLDLFINTEWRTVQPGSTGIIHLPVAKGKVSEEIIEKKRMDSINYMTRRTKMTRGQIIELENVPLGPHEMLWFEIAHKMVKSFKTELV